MSGAPPLRTDRAVEAEHVVRDVLAARERLSPVPLLTRTYGPFSLDEAYRIQDTLTERLVRQLGPVAGYKVAFATPSAFMKYGLREPVCGRLFERQRVVDGGAVQTRDFFLFHVEVEVAFTIDRRIDARIADLAALRPFVRSVHPALDVADTIFDPAHGEQTIADFVAGGAGAHRYVVGPPVDPDMVDLGTLVLRLIVDGQNQAEGPTTEALGSPWQAMLWMVNHLVERGLSLEPGQVVLTGKVAPPYKAAGDAARGEYVGDCGPLGRVGMTVH